MNKYHYQFEQAVYNYQIKTIHPLLELYRYQLINELTTKIYKQILDSGLKINLKKIKQYFSQLIMNILAEKTFTEKNIIYLDDGLFNNCTMNQTKQFYNDLNFFLKMIYSKMINLILLHQLKILLMLFLYLKIKFQKKTEKYIILMDINIRWI